MSEFKTLSFVLFDSQGKPHRVQLDKFEGEPPIFSHRGDPAKLLRRWGQMSDLIQMYLMQQVRDQDRETK